MEPEENQNSSSSPSPSKCVLCDEQVFIACQDCFNYLCHNHADTDCNEHNLTQIDSSSMSISENQNINDPQTSSEETTSSRKRKQQSEVKDEKEIKRQKKICKRGGTDHSRISSKKCRLYKPPIAGPAKTATGEKLVPRTIKFKFNSHISDRSIIPTLENALESYNSITYEGAKLLQIYVLHFLETQQPLPIMDHLFI